MEFTIYLMETFNFVCTSKIMISHLKREMDEKDFITTRATEWI